MQTQIRPLTAAAIHAVLDGMEGLGEHGPMVVAVVGPDGKRIAWQSLGGDLANDAHDLHTATSRAKKNFNGHGFAVGVYGASIADLSGLSGTIDAALQGAVH